MESTSRDAAGRPLRVGDIVGGTDPLQPDAATVIGTVTELTGSDVHVQAKALCVLPADRTFIIGRPLLGALGDIITLQLAESGPALYFLTPSERDRRTITHINRAAPADPWQRQVCRPLIGHALDVLDRQARTLPGSDDGPALIYASTDRATLTRVDESTVEDPRERAICQGFLHHAMNLIDEDAFVRPPSPDGER